jgi:type II secretory pathway component PulF
MYEYNPRPCLFSGSLSFIFWIAVYIWMALCLYTIAKKTNIENTWLGILIIIPVVNFIIPCILAFSD